MAVEPKLSILHLQLLQLPTKNVSWSYEQLFRHHLQVGGSKILGDSSLSSSIDANPTARFHVSLRHPPTRSNPLTDGTTEEMHGDASLFC